VADLDLLTLNLAQMKLERINFDLPQDPPLKDLKEKDLSLKIELNLKTLLSQIVDVKTKLILSKEHTLQMIFLSFCIAMKLKWT